MERAGASLHQDALQTLIQAPLSFFTNTDTGVVTNLFSQDLNLIDTELPSATLNTVYSVSLLQLHANLAVAPTRIEEGIKVRPIV